jgi:hypothetical protein
LAYLFCNILSAIKMKYLKRLKLKGTSNNCFFD